MPAALELWVVTLNAGGGRRDAASSPDEAGTGLGAALAGLGRAPDLLGLQEASRLRRGPVQQCLATALASALGAALGTRYRVHFFPILDSRHHPLLPVPQGEGGRGKGEEGAGDWRLATGDRGGREGGRFQLGNAILVRRGAGLRPAPWPWAAQEPNPLAPFLAREGGREGDPPPSTLHPFPSVRSPSPLSVPLPPPRLYSTGTRDTEPRHLALAALSTPGGQRVYFMTTHLATLAGERGPGADPQRAEAASRLRRTECQGILDVIAELRAAEAASVTRRGGPLWPPGGVGGGIILTGDFNAQPASPELDLLSATGGAALRPPGQLHWREGTARAGDGALWTHVGDRVQIDHILVNDPAGRLDPKDYGIWNDSEVETMTDHYPVVARFALRSAEERS